MNKIICYSILSFIFQMVTIPHANAMYITEHEVNSITEGTGNTRYEESEVGTYAYAFQDGLDNLTTYSYAEIIVEGTLHVDENELVFLHFLHDGLFESLNTYGSASSDFFLEIRGVGPGTGGVKFSSEMDMDGSGFVIGDFFMEFDSGVVSQLDYTPEQDYGHREHEAWFGIYLTNGDFAYSYRMTSEAFLGAPYGDLCDGDENVDDPQCYPQYPSVLSDFMNTGVAMFANELPEGVTAVQIPVGSTVPVPEPATVLLFGVGLASLVGSRIKRKK